MNILNENIRVLLVEDSPSDAELIQLMLLDEMDNLEFHRVYSDEDLRRSLATFDPQIIISDYSMPGFSGLEALSICRMTKPDAPFIFVSGTIGEERAVEALKNGASDYVLKNSLSRLPHAIRQAVVIQRDKRQKKRQQEELARTYELLNSIFDTTHMMVAYMDTDFNFIQVNRSFAEMTSRSPQFYLGKNFFELFPDDSKTEMFREVVQTGKPHFQYMDSSLDDDGNRDRDAFRYFDWSIAPTKSYGMTEGLVFTCLDITERVKLRSERDELLRTLEERVIQRTAELKGALEQLATFKKDITDSITYAKRIQDAFIPSRSAREFHVADAFVIDLPRDILSGDFHWSYHNTYTDSTFVVVADCTGHGIPASLMTLLAVQLLEQSLVEYQANRSPAQVLHDIDESIISFLNQEDESKMMNDGMEIVLFRIDHKHQKVTYASAGRPVYLFSDSELKRLQSSKGAVGGIVKGRQKNFEEFELRYKKGDRVYVFSDGVVDQFGGERGGKFLRKRLETMLTELQEFPFSEHAKVISDQLQVWKGNLEQVDDIIFLGMEF
ncbi:MAG: SpoIIE family protein phosphatase [Flavobacteriales bacterium]|nr:SpoIIE family protein phosphatase [Flavobacteriales bacterium]